MKRNKGKKKKNHDIGNNNSLESGDLQYTF